MNRPGHSERRSGVALVRDAELEAAHSLRRTPLGAEAPRRVPVWWLLALGVLVAVSWWWVLTQGRGGIEWSELATNVTEFLQRLLGAPSAATPAFRETDAWGQAARLALDTVVMSVVAAGLAGGAALLSISFASHRLTAGPLAVVGRRTGRVLRTATRSAHVVTRSIPGYLWALLVVFVLRAGIVAGAVALALHNFGVIGRLGSELIDDLESAPLAALRSSGASTLQVLFYGVVPQVLPQMLTFLLYRWEVMVRESAVVGFVTAAGLGYALRLALARFDYTWITVLLAAYVLLTLLADLLSSALRRLAR